MWKEMSTYQNRRKCVVKRFQLSLQTISLVQMRGEMEPQCFRSSPPPPPSIRRNFLSMVFLKLLTNIIVFSSETGGINMCQEGIIPMGFIKHLGNHFSRKFIILNNHLFHISDKRIEDTLLKKLKLSKPQNEAFCFSLKMRN